MKLKNKIVCRSFLLFPLFLTLVSCAKPEATSDPKTAAAELPPSGVVLDAKSTVGFTPGKTSISYEKGVACLNGQSQDWYVVEMESQSGQDALEFSATALPTANQTYLLNKNLGLNWIYNASETIGASSNCVDESCGSTSTGGNEASDSIRQASIDYLTVPNTNGEAAVISFTVSYSDGKEISGTINVPVVVSGVSGGGCQ